MLTLRDIVAAHLASLKPRKAATLVDIDASYRAHRQKLDTYDEHEAVAKQWQSRLAEWKKDSARGDATSFEAWHQVFDYKQETQLEVALYVYNVRFNGLWELAIAVLQRYSLPLTLRKKMEAVSKYWATKQRAQKPRLPRDRTDKLDAVLTKYLQNVDTLRSHLATIGECLSKGRLIEEGSATEPTRVKAGPFTLVNMGGFDDATMQQVAAVVKQAADAATTSGFGKVCYGDVHVTQKISKKDVLAFYFREQDELFVRADAKVGGKPLFTILHELGHRYVNKIATGKLKAVPNYLFLEISGLHHEEVQKSEPKAGDIMKTKKGEEFEVLYTRGNTVHLRKKIPEHMREMAQRVGERSAREQGYAPGTPAYQAEVDRIHANLLAKYKAMGAKVSLEGYYALQGKTFRGHPDFRGFITPYAATDAEENFCEMFSYYCVGELPPTQAALFEQAVFDQIFTFR
jgi:hypothetical protein